MRVQERLRPGGHRCYWLKRWSSPIFGCSVRGGTETPGCSPSVTLPGDNRDDGPGAKPDNQDGDIVPGVVAGGEPAAAPSPAVPMTGTPAHEAATARNSNRYCHHALPSPAVIACSQLTIR